VIETKSVAPLILVSQFVAFALDRKHTVTGMKIRSIQPNQFGPPQPEPKRSPTIAASRTPAPRIPPSIQPVSLREHNFFGTCTNSKCLCYNSVTGQGQLLWVGVCLHNGFGRRFSLVSMVSIKLGIRFYGVETGDAGESIESEESH
jgi:hypothetical protein